jgi:hypothetical protein
MDPFACKELQSLEHEAGGVADAQARLVAEKVCECVHGFFPTATATPLASRTDSLGAAEKNVARPTPHFAVSAHCRSLEV